MTILGIVFVHASQILKVALHQITLVYELAFQQLEKILITHCYVLILGQLLPSPGKLLQLVITWILDSVELLHARAMIEITMHLELLDDQFSNLTPQKRWSVVLDRILLMSLHCPIHRCAVGLDPLLSRCVNQPVHAHESFSMPHVAITRPPNGSEVIDVLGLIKQFQHPHAFQPINSATGDFHVVNPFIEPPFHVADAPPGRNGDTSSFINFVDYFDGTVREHRRLLTVPWSTPVNADFRGYGCRPHDRIGQTAIRGGCSRSRRSSSCS